MRIQAVPDRSTYIAKSMIPRPGAPDLLHGLDAQARAQVLAQGSLRHFAAGEAVFTQGQRHDGIHLIRQGEVRAYYLAPSGREITLAYWQSGHFVGGPEVFGGGTHIWSGETTRPSELLFLSGAGIRALVEALPRFAVNVIDGVVFKATCFSSLLQMIGTRPVGEVLARVLINLAEDQANAAHDTVRLDPRYTQEELAKMVGATRQWIAATLARLRERGLIELRDSSILVHLPALRRFASDL